MFTILGRLKIRARYSHVNSTVLGMVLKLMKMLGASSFFEVDILQSHRISVSRRMLV